VIPLLWLSRGIMPVCFEISEIISVNSLSSINSPLCYFVIFTTALAITSRGKTREAAFISIAA
jgi:hypothetical protein